MDVVCRFEDINQAHDVCVLYVLENLDFREEVLLELPFKLRMLDRLDGEK